MPILPSPLFVSSWLWPSRDVLVRAHFLARIGGIVALRDAFNDGVLTDVGCARCGCCASFSSLTLSLEGRLEVARALVT